MKRRRLWKGKGKDSVKRKTKGWAWVLEEMGTDGMAGGRQVAHPFVSAETLLPLRRKVRMVCS